MQQVLAFIALKDIIWLMVLAFSLQWVVHNHQTSVVLNGKIKLVLAAQRDTTLMPKKYAQPSVLSAILITKLQDNAFHATQDIL
jgi:hypothetical protein